MAPNEFHLSFAEDPARSSVLCVRCGKAADVHVVLLGEIPQRSGSFCLPCSQTLMHDLRQQRTASEYADLAGTDATVDPLLPHNSALHEDAEGGIIFWEGHGWSSDGPFAGA